MLRHCLETPLLRKRAGGKWGNLELERELLLLMSGEPVMCLRPSRRYLSLIVQVDRTDSFPVEKFVGIVHPAK